MFLWINIDFLDFPLLVLFILLELDYRIFALALDPLHSAQNQSELYVKK